MFGSRVVRRCGADSGPASSPPAGVRGPGGQAVVVETNYVRRLPDEVVVHYRVDGLLRQATLTVSSAGDFEVGQRITVEYDPG